MLQCNDYKLELELNKWGNVELIVQNAEQCALALLRKKIAAHTRILNEQIAGDGSLRAGG
jgi:hypothetical protein